MAGPTRCALYTLQLWYVLSYNGSVLRLSTVWIGWISCCGHCTGFRAQWICSLRLGHHSNSDDSEEDEWRCSRMWKLNHMQHHATSCNIVQLCDIWMEISAVDPLQVQAIFSVKTKSQLPRLAYFGKFGLVVLNNPQRDTYGPVTRVLTGWALKRPAVSLCRTKVVWAEQQGVRRETAFHCAKTQSHIRGRWSDLRQPNWKVACNLSYPRTFQTTDCSHPFLGIIIGEPGNLVRISKIISRRHQWISYWVHGHGRTLHDLSFCIYTVIYYSGSPVSDLFEG